MKFFRHKEKKETKGVAVKKTYTPRFYKLILSGAVVVAGVGLFSLYFVMPNVAVGAGGFAMVVAGILTFRHYWKEEGGIHVEDIAGRKKDELVNSLNIYPDRVEFANVDEPKGFPMLCLNLKKSFYIYIWDEAERVLVPFVLPDQQYCDPDVFAQRVLGLPAHRRIFARKPKLLQRLKTVLLVAAIGIVWLLILTTTGG